MSDVGDVCRIVFRTEDGAEYFAETRAGASLLDAARDAGAAIDAPCAGNGTCGKCRVKIISGEIESVRGRHIAESDFSAGFRLACESVVTGDAEILIPESALAWQSRIRVEETHGEGAGEKVTDITDRFVAAGFVPKKDVLCAEVKLDAPSLDDAEADTERLLRSAAEVLSAGCDTGSTPKVSITIGALRKLPAVLRDNDFSVHCLIAKDSSAPCEGGAEIFTQSADGVSSTCGSTATIIDVSAERIRPVGLAVDIGTTTVSALLADLETGEALAAGSAGNGQIRYGADVINRLIEGARPGGAERLRKAVVDECLAPLTRSICAEADIDPFSVAKVSITGNTTMAHLLLGVPGENIRMEPYVPAFFAIENLRGADVGIGVNPDAAVYIAPSVGSYVGGDITAGVLSSGIHRSAENSVLIDLGTNGEIVLAGDGFLMTCACSAGPAFEGGDMSCGMRATDGAVEAVRINEDTMEPTLQIIGDIPPVGICGSGLIDLISELFRCRIIDARGKFIREGERIKSDDWDGKYFIVEGDVVITETDIDNFIRAKGSVFSAMRTMFELTGLTTEDIAHIYIAGGIGSAIDIGSAIRIGMLPAIPEEHYKYIGNTSLAGAYQVLLSQDARAQLAEIRAGMTYIELSAHPGYMDEFIAACFLPHTDASLFNAPAI